MNGEEAKGAATSIVAAARLERQGECGARTCVAIMLAHAWGRSLLESPTLLTGTNTEAISLLAQVRARHISRVCFA